jgi:TRAP transporter TAXI family solute receptor
MFARAGKRSVKWSWLFSCLAALLLVAAACAAPATGGETAPAAEAEEAEATEAEEPAEEEPAAEGEKQRLVIVTGGTGGVFFPYGGGLARILTENMPNTEVTAEVTGGSVDNMKLIQAGDADIGLSTVDSAYDAINGADAYADTGPVPAVTLATLYPSFLHVVALAESGITTVPDMAGKRVSVGSAGSSTEIAANRILEAAGLDPMADITRDSLSVAESVAAMKDQKIDAFFWIGGLPTSAVTDLTTTPNLAVNFIDISGYLDAMVEKYGPVYTPFALPADTYAGQTAEVPGVGINNILFVNEDMSSELVTSILTTIFDNLDEVRTVHPEADKLSLESAVVGSSIPFHPAAIAYYTEQGVWQE